MEKVIMIKQKRKTHLVAGGEPEAPHGHQFLNMPQRNVGAKEEASAFWRKPVAQLKKEDAVSKGGRCPGIKKKGRE